MIFETLCHVSPLFLLSVLWSAQWQTRTVEREQESFGFIESIDFLFFLNESDHPRHTRNHQSQ